MTVPFAGPQTAPENRPTALSELLAPLTPTAVHYRRNHFPYPRIDPGTWRLPVTGAVAQPVELTLDDLRTLPSHEATVLLECAGHRRTEFVPAISGVQWSLGALSQAHWAGPRLAGVLELAGLAPGAVEVVLHGADRGPFPEVPGVHSFSRSLPLHRALHPDTLVALEMNGEPLPDEHGAPARAVIPGWYAMDSVKWLAAIEVVTEPFRGPFQELDYRFQGADEQGIGTRIEEMPVHSLFVTVAGGELLPAGEREVAGIAWGGSGVAAVDVRVGTGDWEPAKVTASGPYQRVLWTATVTLEPGRARLAVRATDTRGRTQPEKLTWNRRGYVNNSVQHLDVLVV
jgi:DMSO/TMAO reductase YedYZ molybdopterin-dependent catalytic subunit